MPRAPIVHEEKIAIEMSYELGCDGPIDPVSKVNGSVRNDDGCPNPVLIHCQRLFSVVCEIR